MVNSRWRIPETFDGLEDPTAYGSHSEGSTTIIYDPPGAKDRVGGREMVKPSVLTVRNTRDPTATEK